MSAGSTAAIEFLQIHDRRHRRFENDVGDAGGIVATDRTRTVDDNLDVEAVIDEQDDLRRNGRAAIASQLLGVGQFRSRAAAQCNREFPALDRIAVCVGMRTGRKRCRVVQETPRPGNNALAAFRVVTFARCPVGISRNGVRAVEGIVKRAPSRIRRVERIARIADRHDKLWSRHGGDLLVDVGCIDRESRPFRHEIADLFEEGLVSLLVERATPLPAIPIVDPGLKIIASLQERAIYRSKAVDDLIETLPERRGIDPGAGNDFIDDEVMEDFRNLQTGNGYALNFRHPDVPA